VKLFEPRPTVRYARGAELAANFGGQQSGDGENPPSGVVLPFYLKEKPSSAVTLAISRDLGDGKVEAIRSFTFEPEGASGTNESGSRPGGRGLVARAGANRFVWDMRYPGPDVIQGVVFQGRAAGPLAPPGTYRAELTAGGRTERRSFTIEKDPRLEFSDAQLVEQFQFLMNVRDKLTETMNVVRRIRDMRKQAEDLVAKQGARNKAATTKALQALNDKLYPIEERLVQYRARAGQDLINYPTAVDSKLARLLDFASMGDAPPTQGSLDLFRRLSQDVAERVKLVDEVERREYAAVIKLAGGATQRR
jgi:hypothetical protein